MAEPSGATRPADTGSSTVLQVLGAVGTGVGVLGFVAAIGGMIVYTRADAAGLPADQALAVMPRTLLVATGAVTLVPAVALAFLFVLLLYCVSWAIDQVEKRRIDQSLPEAVRVEERAAYAEEEARDWRRESREAKRRVESAQKAIEALQSTPAAPPNDLERLAREQAAAVEQAVAADHHAADCERQADHLTSHAKQMRAEHAEASTKVQWAVRVAVGVALLALQLLALAVLGAGADGVGQWLVLLLLAAATAFVSVTIYSRRSRRFLFIVSAFMALGLFIGFASYYRTKNTPKLAPAAALRVDGTIVFGYFVAETDKDVYVARPETTGVRARILQLPRAEVTDVAVGKLTAPENFPLLDARGIARRLCAEGARGADTGVGTSLKAKAMAPHAPAPAPVLDATELRCANAAEAAGQAFRLQRP